ncbi:ABC transporter substrate-binding protein [Bradyrhizobium sp. AUGA SZCCT0042]|uniref:ABC transporter substrate-binding protein n=1 Tax=Bradyrhizobium sp. AUGA SZCCT0042 TaxID=2807651 RepID=UPI001BA9EC6D|nr:ABC transporter substrate-binding protein [Bradyrhizobium sp. AUGA SZCCT0042]MBR1301083.1 ABC transporter substrate-binding protein [Bradyrhizobium sp. AUGA SZCCT0042]
MRLTTNFAVCAALIVYSSAAIAQSKYDAGASDSEIKVGNIMPYSGPVSALSIVGKAEAAYFKMINEQGGINGRKINFISYDDAYSPPKTVEQARRLVEDDEVLFMAGSFGTAGNSAIQKYMNAKRVPQIFIASAADKWADPKHFPWSMGWMPSSRSEARYYAKYIIKNISNAKVAVLYQNDDFGKEYLIGLKEGLGDKASSMLVAEVAYEVTSPTIESQIVLIKSKEPTVLINAATPKFAAQAIKKVGELGWKPVQFVTNASSQINSVMKPAGLDNAQGILSVQYIKDPGDQEWRDDPDVKEWREFMQRYYPDGNKDDSQTIWGYGVAKAIAQVIRQCGNELTRENVMRQAANLDFYNGVTLPGIKIKTGPGDFKPIEQFQMMRVKGDNWERFGEIIGEPTSE